MKTVSIKSDSWHHWLATFGNRPLCSDDHNICSYTRKILSGAGLLALIVFLVGGFVAPFGDALAWIVACIAFGMWLEVWFMAIPAMAVTVVAFALVCCAFVHYLKEDKHITFVPPIVAEIYESVHDKTCFKISVDEES